MTTKAQLISALRSFVAQRSGIDARNYLSSWRDLEGRKALRADQYTISKDGEHARELIRSIEHRDGITADDMLKHLSTGRLTWNESKGQFDYCTGQYFPTEYRGAVCRALIAVIIDYGRTKRDIKADMPAWLTQQVGRSIASRWF